MRRARALPLLVLASAFSLSACQTVQNTAGTPTQYLDPGSSGVVRGVGIEGQDIRSMSDEMMRDLLTVPALANASISPNVIVDAEYFQNESSSRINKNIITDRLRVDLNRASRGRMQFVGRQYADMVQSERNLNQAGVVSGGTIARTAGQLAGDYRLGGRITIKNARDPRSGMIERTHQITFEMVNLQNGQIIWSNYYDLRKAAQDDIIYR